MLADPDDTFLRELCEYHVSGQLKVAPEHVSDPVLQKMGKPEYSVYQKFVEKYNQMNKKLRKDQYLVPYLMSSHPGSTLKEAVNLAEHLRDFGLYAGAGTGFLSDTVHSFYLYVLHRRGSAEHAAGICAEESS